eukprot:TRINITY_DN17233_c0_g1_i1.p1 TRINITY_DN17233_c0_g1~~TRINITY_DN17233_c0_g1_i1.p1  ORF type:complete len:369 (+),score=107.08 TRINITY_DN17233_c0_g1_i1:89-1108(+)
MLRRSARRLGALAAPTEMWHITAVRNLSGILTYGLRPSQSVPAPVTEDHTPPPNAIPGLQGVYVVASPTQSGDIGLANLHFGSLFCALRLELPAGQALLADDSFLRTDGIGPEALRKRLESRAETVWADYGSALIPGNRPVPPAIIKEVAWLWPDGSDRDAAVDEAAGAAPRQQPLKLLRAVAAQRGVGLQGCLDKDDVVERLEQDQRMRNAAADCADLVYAAKTALYFRLRRDAALCTTMLTGREYMLRRRAFDAAAVAELESLEGSPHGARIMERWKEETVPGAAERVRQSEGYITDGLEAALARVAQTPGVDMHRYRQEAVYADTVNRNVFLPPDE